MSDNEFAFLVFGDAFLDENAGTLASDLASMSSWAAKDARFMEETRLLETVWVQVPTNSIWKLIKNLSQHTARDRKVGASVS
jgi:hypothetical protein